MITIQDILTELDSISTDTRHKGDLFENLMKDYLQTEPLYADRFSKVWKWMEWPERGSMPDTGIDLVAEERTGGVCAIQCKFYASEYTLQKGDIDSFLATSGKHPFTSRIVCSTSNEWSKNAEEAIADQQIPVIRIQIQDLLKSSIDWSHFSLKKATPLKLKPKKEPFAHQLKAIENTLAGFKKSDRGKLIMSCGTGKTFTALKIAEAQSRKNGTVLFLAPSIALVSQTLREWTAQAASPLRCFAVCSDPTIGKGRETAHNEDMRAHDLEIPATTNAKWLAYNFTQRPTKSGLTVVFSTYHSIKVLHDAQKYGLPEFDLIICDEAHRTTGVTLSGEDESHFVKVHDARYIQARKRLYMTATPRVYSDASQTQAKENDAVLCSMDDESLYGPEFYYLGFGEAVERKLLTDYKVLVLAVDEKYISRTFQRQLADSNHELKLDDAVKIVGCLNGLSKRMSDEEAAAMFGTDRHPMRRAVAFATTINYSQRVVNLVAEISDFYKKSHSGDSGIIQCEAKHVDGKTNIMIRNRMLDWLREGGNDEDNTCRLLSNARCLTEGVDVPALDACVFLNPRDSVIDVVQAVGRVMRNAPGKNYGYIIVPVGIPSDMTPEEALKDHKRYKVVWQVLQALRSHDDRFRAMINKIDLNKKPDDHLQVVGVGGGHSEEETAPPVAKQIRLSFPQIDEWREAIYAKIVTKCGERDYWETWAADVAKIAERHIARIKQLLAGKDKGPRKAFDNFLAGLHENLNPSITEDAAIEMLAQHLITKPVFDALFEGYEFTRVNPVSIAMQKVLDVMERQALEKETESLSKFYQSVRKRAEGINTAEGKQRIVLELYDKFFRVAFKKMSERLGIVYTPVEVVDFILHSVDHALRQEFGKSISDKDVHILDPFSGTGTFMVRLLQSGLIQPEDLERKYTSELHANELVLLAYYIAAINIEETYHALKGGAYQPFDGMVLTDTFQMSEGINAATLGLVFPENNKRVTRQRKLPIRVIVGNPPYSAQQKSENDNNKNLAYLTLDDKIRKTYAAASDAGLVKNLYDSYVRAIRWSSDRISDKGIVCFVTNGSYIDANNMDGLRKCLYGEFSTIYCLNLRGNQRTSGELSRKEGGKIFGSGSRTPVAIMMLIKNPAHKGECKLLYHDIGDYLSREDKLQALASTKSISGVEWTQLNPNEQGDWIGQRNEEFEAFIALGDKESKESTTIFTTYSLGVVTNRDPWAYNFSSEDLHKNIRRTISFYNSQAKVFQEAQKKSKKALDVAAIVDSNPAQISWTRALKNDARKNTRLTFHENNMSVSMYRPFTKCNLYFDRKLNEMVYLMPKLFPFPAADNLVISTTGIGATKTFSGLITDTIPNLHLHDTGQCFPLFVYQKDDDEKPNLFSQGSEYRKVDAISDKALQAYRTRYDASIKKEDIFYYVYGILHSTEYKERFADDLKKMLPRIPFATDFWTFSKAGRELAKLHLNYETCKKYPLKESRAPQGKLSDLDYYRVEQMKFAKRGKEVDRTTILFNSHITLSGIPAEAYEYIVNGKSALDWIIERYAVTTDKASGIVNDPNDWSAEHDNPTYILDLVKRIVHVSLETVRIVKCLPELGV